MANDGLPQITKAYRNYHMLGRAEVQLMHVAILDKHVSHSTRKGECFTCSLIMFMFHSNLVGFRTRTSSGNNSNISI